MKLIGPICFALCVLFILFGIGLTIVHANNPGGHMIQFTGIQGTNPCILPACSFNVYRGTVKGVCGKGLQPYDILGTTQPVSFFYEDDNVIAGTTYFYAFTAYPQTGGESNCSAELQTSVLSTTQADTGMFSGKAH